ncbi:MAG: AgmX/PglI C-terminal domain-containing protein [Gammaproteobacteria bacterium]|jgi:periplasmic protein TonB
MAYTGIWQDNLPWSDNENDRKVVGYIFISLFICTILYLIIQFIPVPPVKEQKLEVVAPRLAKLIIEQQKRLKPPPPPPQVKKKEAPKAEPKKAVKPKARPRPKRVAPRKTPRPKPDHAAVARRQAQKHITEIQDALAGLRQINVASSIEHNKPIRHSAGNREHSARNRDNTTAIIAAQADKGSGGINTSRLSRATGSSHLQGRRTTAVTSSLATQEARAGGSSGGGGKAHTRPYDEIELVFQKNKGSIFSLYTRALRRDPTLQGKVVLELTITPAGHVTRVRIVSSEIKDARLLQQLKMRVKLFRFKSRNVDTLIVRYPIDFLPT